MGVLAILKTLKLVIIRRWRGWWITPDCKRLLVYGSQIRITCSKLYLLFRSHDRNACGHIGDVKSGSGGQACEHEELSYHTTSHKSHMRFKWELVLVSFSFPLMLKRPANSQRNSIMNEWDIRASSVPKSHTFRDLVLFSRFCTLLITKKQRFQRFFVLVLNKIRVYLR